MIIKSEQIIAIENEIIRLKAIERSLSAIHNKTQIMFKLTTLEHELGHELIKEIKSQHSIDETLDKIESVLNIT